jgi:cell division protein FtsA
VIALQTVSGIDVGTTKVCTVVASVAPDGELSVIGIGRVPSRGLRKGIVTDIERTIASIRESKAQAEQMAGVDIDSAFVGVTGAHIQAQHSNAVVGIADPQKGITDEDMERAQDLAQRVDFPRGRRLIDVRVKEYIVDGQIGIADPVGMNGMRLEVNALLISAAIPQLENIYRAANQAGIDVEEIVIQPIASAEAVLTNDEREMGVAVVDMGGGTTDLAVFQHGAISHLAIFPVGGDHFDSDLSYGIGITPRQAEHLKIHLGGVGDQFVKSGDIIEITKGGDRKSTIPLKIIADIINPRLEEILLLVRDNLNAAGLLKQIPSGLVLTGGTALLPGMTDMAGAIFDLPIKIGYPRDVDGLTEDIRNPIFATGIGLVKIGSMEYEGKRAVEGASSFTSAFSNISAWQKSVMKFIFK